MTQEELEHLLHARAGPRGPLNVFQFTEQTKEVEVDDPTTVSGKRKIGVPVRTWTDPGTGHVVSVQANPDGTYVKLFDGIDPKAVGEPSVPPPTAAQQQPQVVPTNTTEPYIVIRQPDGTLSSQPNPNFQGAPPKPGTNLHIESGGKHYIIPIDATGKAGAAQDLGLPAEAKPGSRSLVDGGDGQKYIVTIGADNTVTTTDTAGRPVPGGVPPKRDPGTIRYNPETGEYEQVRTDPATGRATVSAVPREGAGAAAPRSPAPLLPQIVVGQSQDALRTAYTQIQEEVDSGRRTAAWGENRRKEVFEAAQITVQEAQLAQQRDLANQTTRFNVSNTVLQYGQSALENALKFTLELNDKLTPGSGSGGRMFTALFNLQMKMAKDSGIYDQGVPRGSSVGQPGAPGQPPTAPGAAPQPPGPRLTNVGDPDAVEADHQRSVAQLAAGDTADAAAAAASPGGRAFTPSYSTPGASNVPGFAPGMPPTAPPGGAAVPPVPLPQPAAAPGAVPPAAMPALAPPPGFSEGPPGGGAAQDPGIYQGPPGGGAAQDPGIFEGPVRQGMPTTAPYGHGGMAQPGGYPALDALRQQFAPQPMQLDPSGGLDQQTGGIAVPGLPPALQRAQIAATPPWRLNPADLDRLVQEHGPETVFGWPGQSLLGQV